MSDLDQLRAWRSAEPGRALVLLGLNGKDGVKLVRWLNGDRYEATHDSVTGAALALANGTTPFRKAISEPAQPRYLELRGAAKRRAPRPRTTP